MGPVLPLVAVFDVERNWSANGSLLRQGIPWPTPVVGSSIHGFQSGVLQVYYTKYSGLITLAALTLRL